MTQQISRLCDDCRFPRRSCHDCLSGACPATEEGIKISLPEGWKWLGEMAVFKVGDQTFAEVSSDGHGGIRVKMEKPAVERGALLGLGRACLLVSEMVWAPLKKNFVVR